MGKQKITRGNAGQFFVAGELCRRGHSAVVTSEYRDGWDLLEQKLRPDRDLF